MIKLLPLLLLSGCGVLMSHTAPPTGWPVLTERIERPGFITVQQKCGGSLFGVVAGCAAPNLYTGVCTIYSAVSGEDHARLLEHEREHCKGKSHLGSSMYRDYYVYWNCSGRPRMTEAAYASATRITMADAKCEPQLIGATR